ncbi:hypothetical protein Q6D67_07495 [Haliea sp. E1-2-M8]|uniref:hypothetical protein n=1 Tax=Haliea sp. E1-2-M8 TaxID=3064706 RepID=UPI0027260E1C|nr:hypothetical protein [Haliea sp. E1-2-M8]MDO8861542.1 hypothetical protein [Haliea sp. E1-2-M8]
MARNLSIDKSVAMATRHPQTCARLLGNNLYPLLEHEPWFNKQWRAQFCAYYLQNLADNSIEQEVDPELMERLKKLPLQRTFPMIADSPCAGVKMLVAILSQRLRQEQKLGIKEQYEFYDVLFGRFFPEARR